MSWLCSKGQHWGCEGCCHQKKCTRHRSVLIPTGKLWANTAHLVRKCALGCAGKPSTRQHVCRRKDVGPIFLGSLGTSNSMKGAIQKWTAHTKVAFADNVAVALQQTTNKVCEVLMSSMTHTTVLHVQVSGALLQTPRSLYVVVPARAEPGSCARVFGNVNMPLFALVRVNACSLAGAVPQNVLDNLSECAQRRFWRYTGKPKYTHIQPGATWTSSSWKTTAFDAVPAHIQPDPPATLKNAPTTCAWCGVSYPTFDVYATACAQ